MNENLIKRNIDHLIDQCIETSRKKVLVLYDSSTEKIIDYFDESLKSIGMVVKKISLRTSSRHGIEPPDFIVNEMLRHDTIMCLTKYSLAHTKARRLSEQSGICFLSMPEYDLDMLENEAFLVDYHEVYKRVKNFSENLTRHNLFHIKTLIGTDVSFDATGRKGNCCPGFTDSEHLLGSPPDIEANIAPLENRTNGVIVVDGSVTVSRIGLLHKPVILTVSHGVVTEIECDEKEIELAVKRVFKEVRDEKAYIVGEFGVGFNKQAKLCGNMLIDEGAKGCIHFGIGSNWTIGGDNKVPFHLDFVMKGATVVADGEELITGGKIVDE